MQQNLDSKWQETRPPAFRTLKATETSYKNSEIHQIIEHIMNEYQQISKIERWRKLGGKWQMEGSSGDTFFLSDDCVVEGWPGGSKQIPVYKPYPAYGFLEETFFSDEAGVEAINAIFIADERSDIVKNEHPSHPYPTMGYNFGGKHAFELRRGDRIMKLTRQGGTYERECRKWTNGWTPKLKVWKFQYADRELPFSVCLVVPYVWQPDESAAAVSAAGEKRSRPEPDRETAEWIAALAGEVADRISARLAGGGGADAVQQQRADRRLRQAIQRCWEDGTTADADAAARGGSGGGD